jgi:hypothetical protein
MGADRKPSAIVEVQMPILRTASLTVILLVAAVASSPAAAKTCKSHTVVGEVMDNNSEPEALVLARLEWAVIVTNSYGVAWRNYNIAANKREQCERVGPVGRPRCRVEARPCKN